MQQNELPEGWENVPLMEICSLIRGVSYKRGEEKDEANEDYVPLIRANNIQKVLQFEDLKYVPSKLVSSEKLLTMGDVIIALSSGSKKVVGKAVTLSKPWFGTFGAFCGVLRPNNYISWKYFGYYFQTSDYRDFISIKSSGVNINNLKREYFEQIYFPLPPLPEQHRIVAAIEALFTRLDATNERLDRVSEIMKAFRQAVLATACDGRLTEDWREEQSGLPDARELLEQIHREREKTAKASGKKVKSVKTVTDNELEELPKLPQEWTWIYLDSLGCLARGKSKHRPRDDAILFGGEYPFIQTGEVRAAKHTISTFENTYSEFGLAQSKLWPKGTLCITIAANIAETAFLGFDACFPDSIVGFSPSENIVIKEYIHYFLKGNQSKIEAFAPATAQKNINLKTLENLFIPYCSLSEQQEIVRRVDALFAFADSIEAKVKAAREKTERLRQSILAKAFSGELVPTEAELARQEGREYESAEVLLERIKAEGKSGKK